MASKARLRAVASTVPEQREPRRSPDADTLARIVYQLRRRREDHFGHALFSEPAWDILLDLYIAAAEGRRICVSSACIGAAAPSTTSLRWLSLLEDLGHVVREVDSKDARRHYVRLSAVAFARMESLLEETADLIGARGEG